MLGVTRIRRAGKPIDLPARKVRSVLAALTLDPGAVSSADRLVDLIWGESAPRGAHGTLHSYISGLRRVLEPDLPARAQPQVLLTSDVGYRLTLGRDAVDATAFTDQVRLLHRQIATLESQFSVGSQPGWPHCDQAHGWLEALEAALRRWRGHAYADLGDHPDVVAARTGLDELRTTAEEDRALVMLALGDPAGVVADTELATARHPFRERTWAVHVLALVRSERQADALAAIRRLRDQLADELGLDPGSLIRTLENAVLRQDPAILQTLPSRQPPERANHEVAPVAVEPPTAMPRGTFAVPILATIGRERERTALDEVLDAAVAGRPSVAVIVGEPGMGKSRLTEDLSAAARSRGISTATAACSAEDGAPPLWPWQALLSSLVDTDREHADQPALGGETMPVDLAGLRARLAGNDDGSSYAERAFAVSELLAGSVRERAAGQPLLLIVDDLHWADAPSLRALSHLIATARAGECLAVVVTRRPLPEPSGALADLEITMVRRGARQVRLTGLPVDDAARLVDSVVGTAAAADLIATWCDATGGNPFFLVELARLAVDRDGWSGEVPAAVQTVVRRRLDRLPADTRELLVAAAALGQQFSLLMLAAGLDREPELADERLDPAREAGIIRDSGGMLAFEHALTRDAVLASVGSSLQARLHARMASAYERPDAPVAAESRPFELARHWLAAGPVHAGRAWPAAAEAARLATAAFAHEEAVDLYRAALAAQLIDPRAETTERFDLLLKLAEVAAYAGTWQHVVAAAAEAVRIAAAARDPSRVARAAVELTRHSIWTPQEFGVVDDDLVEDLREALRLTGDAVSHERVRLSLALACQLYYADDRRSETAALVDHGLAGAQRLDDAELTRWAARSASIALWRSEHVLQRRRLVEQELAAARELGDLDAEALALTTATGIALELADRRGYQQSMTEALRLARRRRLGYLRIALGCVGVSLAALDDAEGLPAMASELVEVSRQTSVVNHEVFVSSLGFLTLLWNPDAPRDHLDAMVAGVLAGPGAVAVDAAALGLVRLGRLDDVRGLLTQVSLSPLNDSWSSTWDAACHAEISYALGEPGLAEPVAPILRRLSGRLATAGVSIVAGPLDGYLALAEAALGNRPAATAAADRALEQARAWDMSAYVRWLLRHRADGAW